MINAKSLEQARYRKITVKIGQELVEVQAERVKFFDPLKKFEIYKYGKRRVALVDSKSKKVILQDATYISTVKNGIAKYYNTRDEWGIINERAQIICEAGTLNIQRSSKRLK